LSHLQAGCRGFKSLFAHYEKGSSQWDGPFFVYKLMGLEAEIGSYRKPEGLRNDPEKRGASRRAQNTMDGILEAGDGLEPNDLDGRGAEGQVSLRQSKNPL
jgi:hypothetical protein